MSLVRVFAVLAVFAPICLFAGLSCATDKADAKEFTHSIDVQSLKAGADTKVTWTIVPTGGFHWNSEYPASLNLVLPSGIEGAPLAFTKKTDTIRDLTSSAVVAFSLKAGTKGEQILKLKGNFSVCNDKVCRIFREETLEAKVQVQ